MSIFASFVDESLPTDNGEMYCSLCQTQLKVGYYPDLQTRSDCVFISFPSGTKLGRLLPVSRDECDLEVELLSCKECCMDLCYPKHSLLKRLTVRKLLKYIIRV